MTQLAPKTSVFSFFSGAGLLDLAFEDSGFDVVYVNEVFEPFMDAYKHSRSTLGRELPKYGHSLSSIENVLSDEFSEFNASVVKEKNSGAVVGFIGGPPCPDFSVGGKNKGRDGENGKLSKTYIDLVKKAQPHWFIFENVKGLWRTKKHRTFYEELKSNIGKNTTCRKGCSIRLKLGLHKIESELFSLEC